MFINVVVILKQNLQIKSKHLIHIFGKIDQIFYGHPPLSDLVKRLRTNILGAVRNQLTHVPLTEKNWLIYCSKVWDTVKKSPFFVEYMKLMP